jgi:hypothetical protein
VDSRLFTCVVRGQACLPYSTATWLHTCRAGLKRGGGAMQVAMHFLNFEARHIFGSLSQLQLGIVDRFFDMEPDEAKKAVTPMEVSLKQSDELAKFMRFCQQITHTNTNANDLKVRHLTALLVCARRADAGAGQQLDLPPVSDLRLRKHSPSPANSFHGAYTALRAH